MNGPQVRDDSSIARRAVISAVFILGLAAFVLLMALTGVVQ